MNSSAIVMTVKTKNVCSVKARRTKQAHILMLMIPRPLRSRHDMVEPGL